jgi:hypothetical protein
MALSGYYDDNGQPLDSFYEPYPTQPTAPSAPVSQGIAPPWWGNNGPAPFAPGQTWQTNPLPQIDPQGQTWNWDAASNAWKMEAPADPTKDPTKDPTTNPTTPTPTGTNTLIEPGYTPTQTDTTKPPSLLDPFPDTYTAPAQLDLGGPAGISYIPQVPTFKMPEWKAPPKFEYADFKPPTDADVYNDPSYVLRRDEGQRGIETSAAAKGLARTGGTLSDILKYNQGFASSEYGNIWNRDLGAYQTNRAGAVNDYNLNYKTGYVDPWQAEATATQAEFAPKLSEWQTQAAAGQAQNTRNQSQAWDEFLQSFNIFDSQRKFTNSALQGLMNTGMNASAA